MSSNREKAEKAAKSVPKNLARGVRSINAQQAKKDKNGK